MPFALCSASEKLVSEYAGIPLPAVYDLDIITFWALLRDSVIYNRAQTETGRKVSLELRQGAEHGHY